MHGRERPCPPKPDGSGTGWVPCRTGILRASPLPPDEGAGATRVLCASRIVEFYKQFDASIEAGLRRKVTTGFVVAILLTGFMGFLAWRYRQLASSEGDLVVHTYAV